MAEPPELPFRLIQKNTWEAKGKTGLWRFQRQGTADLFKVYFNGTWIQNQWSEQEARRYCEARDART